MIRIASSLAIVLMITAAIGLYRFKDAAAESERHIESLRAQITAERERIAVLRAEWNYLNQPGRIQDLSERYLDLERLDVGQIASIDALPMRPIEIDPYGGALGGFAGGEDRLVQ